jgi:hypothetical protein
MAPKSKTGYGSTSAVAMLTDIQCRNAKPNDKSYKLVDGKEQYLEVKPNDVKAWRFVSGCERARRPRKVCSR